MGHIGRDLAEFAEREEQKKPAAIADNGSRKKSNNVSLIKIYFNQSTTQY